MNKSSSGHLAKQAAHHADGALLGRQPRARPRRHRRLDVAGRERGDREVRVRSGLLKRVRRQRCLAQPVAAHARGWRELLHRRRELLPRGTAAGEELLGRGTLRAEPHRGGARRDVDDPAGGWVDQREDRLAHPLGAEQVHIQKGGGVARRGLKADPGVVDQRIERHRLGLERGRSGRDRRLVTDVDRDQRDPIRGRGIRVADALHRRGTLLGVP
mmetsp:Transcript_29564/g.97349  ORF Transcript_29564/g.97349 Transcript_29564/m.97349 type:complete len:215 (+) Transcript_29564:560-1204(+)